MIQLINISSHSRLYYSQYLFKKKKKKRYIIRRCIYSSRIQKRTYILYTHKFTTNHLNYTKLSEHFELFFYNGCLMHIINKLISKHKWRFNMVSYTYLIRYGLVWVCWLERKIFWLRKRLVSCKTLLHIFLNLL